jgi:hypothetical protein
MSRMKLYDCPECALPATADPRGRCDSTSGPVDHVYVRCVVGHWFLGPVERLLRDANVPDPTNS